MLRKLSRAKRASVYYMLISLGLILLSLIGLVFNEPILIACMAVCSLFGFFILLLLLRSEKATTSEGIKGSFALFTLLRYVLMLVGILCSALLVYFTMSEVINKQRYLLVVISALPYFTTSFAIIFAK